MNNLKDSFNLEGLHSIMKLCNAALLISMIKNSPLWSVREKHCGRRYTNGVWVGYGCFLGFFLVLIYEMMLQPFELNSANVDLKHDAFTPIRSSETYSTYYLQQLASMKCKTLLVLEGKETPEPEI